MHTTRELLMKVQISSLVDATGHPAIRVSPRGKQVLDLFSRSFSRQQIAEQLGMSVSGVRRHCEKMLWKNGCESMLALIAKYQAHVAAKAKDEMQF